MANTSGTSVAPRFKVRSAAGMVTFAATDDELKALLPSDGAPFVVDFDMPYTRKDAVLQVLAAGGVDIFKKEPGQAVSTPELQVRLGGLPFHEDSGVVVSRAQRQQVAIVGLVTQNNYSRSFALRWIKDVPEGAQLFASENDKVPVATVKTWTNGSYWRNYQIDWHKEVREGAPLYADIIHKTLSIP